MNDTTTRKPWGAGRVAFFARLDTIKAEMSQGLPLTTIFDRHRAALEIGYSSFCKLVARYAADAKLTGHTVSRRDTGSVPAPPPKPMPAVLTPAPAPPEGDAHARHEHPARPGSFRHDGSEKPDDRKRLLGED